MTNNKFFINGREISNKSSTYFIADIAANHDGSLESAKELIYLSAEAGANAVKFQNFLANTIVSDQAFKDMGNKLSHQSKWKKSVYEVYDDASLPIMWTEELLATAKEVGVDYLTTPYDLNLVPILSPYVSAWKLGSGDITWHQMIELLAQDDKPLFIATGASEMFEVELAMKKVAQCNKPVVLMQCNTNYTASLENFKYIELNVLKTYQKMFPNVVLGLSDHTPGHSTVLGAIALGARVVEKHFTDDNSKEGPDHKFSMNPKTWKEMVDRSRELENALGSGVKRVMDNEKQSIVVQRRGLCATQDLKAGSVIEASNVSALRPCIDNGIAPYQLSEIIGKVILYDIKKGGSVTWDAIK